MVPFEFELPIVLVGGGAVNESLLQTVVDRGYPVVAADGGANLLREMKIDPQLIIGDMDSLARQHVHTSGTKIVTIPEQDTTDFEKCLYSTSAPLYLAFGFLGGRLDHSMAAVHCLTKYRKLKKVIAVDEVDLMYVPTGPLQLTLPVGSRLSVVPVSPLSFRASEGLEYPLDGLDMKLGSFIGVSNRTDKETVKIFPDEQGDGAYVLILGNTLIDPLIAGISQ